MLRIFDLQVASMVTCIFNFVLDIISNLCYNLKMKFIFKFAYSKGWIYADERLL